MNKRISAYFLTAALLISTHSFAEENHFGDVYELDDVTVTARKAEETAKDVPFSISVIGGDELSNRGIQNFEDMLKQSVGVEVNTYGGVSTSIVRMRGTGALQNASPDDTSVIINIDGVANNVGSATLGTLDVEQVEVLKGPQGTLMGRNSQSGAINIITKKPTREFEGYLRGEYGEKHTFLTEGAVSGPFSKTLSGRLAVKYAGNDSQVTYYGTAEPVTKPRDFGIRGTLLWQPASKTKATLIYSHEEVLKRFGAEVLMPYDDKQQTDIPKDSSYADKFMNSGTLNIEHEFSRALFNSITGYAQSSVNENNYVYNGIVYRKLMGMTGEGVMKREMDDSSFNQEFRFSSKPHDKVFWVTGVNYYHMDRDADLPGGYDSLNPAGWYNAEMNNNFKISSAAVFAETTVPVAEKIKLTAGLRFTDEEKEYDADWKASAVNPNPVRQAEDSGKITDSYFTGRAAVGYELTKQTNIYAVYARGHKTAGFNEWASGFIDGSRADRYYKETETDSYEIGFKYEADNKKYGLNGSAFFNDNKDDHVLVYDVSTRLTQVENFDTESKGVELEGYAKLGHFLISGGVGYTDAEITSVPQGSSSGAEEGNSVPDTPEWNATLSIAHFQHLPAFFGMKNPVLFTKVTDRYMGKRSGDTADNFEMDSYHKLDARIGIQNGSLEVYVWGDNLLDEYYDLYGWYFGKSYVDGSDVVVGMPSKGRTVGAGAAFYF